MNESPKYGSTHVCRVRIQTKTAVETAKGQDFGKEHEVLSENRHVTKGAQRDDPPKCIAHFVLREAVSPTKCCCLLKVKTFGPAQNFGQAAQLYRGIQLRDQSQLITGRGAPQLWQHLQTEQT